MREVVAVNKASAAVEVVCEAMLALWIGTTAGTGAGSDGGFLLNGATIA